MSESLATPFMSCAAVYAIEAPVCRSHPGRIGSMLAAWHAARPTEDVLADGTATFAVEDESVEVGSPESRSGGTGAGTGWWREDA